tara:strand:+ start:149 stop:565 length:417 start_codon:yes stop_codon:yes gene_type:complete
MIANLLLASFIPFLFWIIQKIRKNTSPRSTYIRRRIFAWCLLIIFPIDVFGKLALVGIASEAEAYNAIPRLLIKTAIYWAIIFFIGFRSGREEKENRGYWFSIWEAYKPEYMEGVADEQYVSIDKLDLTKPKNLRNRD